MRVLLRAIGAGLVSTAAALPAYAADHRDAPAISEFPVADVDDIYVFRAPGAPSRLVLAMTVDAVSDTGFAATCAFSPRVPRA